MTDTMRKLSLRDLIEEIRNRASKSKPLIEPERLDEVAYRAGRFLGTSVLILVFGAAVFLCGALAVWWSI